MSCGSPTMRLSTIGLILILSLLTAPPAANAQQRSKVPRIGVLLPGSPTPEYERRLDAFRQGLRELGYIDQQNILLEYRWADAQCERMADLVAKLLRLMVDVLVIDSVCAALAAKRATSTLPIVLATAGDPVATGLVESLARRGGNITGMSLMHAELGAKRLEMLKDMVPTAARVAVLLNPDNPNAQLQWRELDVAAPRLDVQLQAVEVRRAIDLGQDCAARHRLPTMTGLRTMVDAGGLMSYGASGVTAGFWKTPPASSTLVIFGL